MDGVYNSEFRKIFLLTTNDLSINPNLMSRPSRIRYVREFGNLEQEIVEEFLNDELKDQSCKDELIDYIDSLTISTIDILKAIVEEVNIHGIEEFLKFKNSFNVENAHYTYYTICGEIDESDLMEHHYDVNKFVKELASYKGRYELDQKFRSALDAASSDEEREKLKNEYYESIRREAYFDYESIYNQDKAWNKLRTGKDKFNGEKVIKVDIEKKIVVTKFNSRFNFYFIENPTVKPSLYKDVGTLSYVL
jgi:hypothetical protein